MFGIRQALGIDFSDDAWRIVALRTAGAGYELVYAASFALNKELSEDAATSLGMLLREAKGARQRVAGSLPTSGCAFKTASLPPGTPTALAQVARFEAENQFPLPLQDLVWGFSLVPEPSGRQHAVIAGARRSMIEERLALLRMAGAKTVALLPAPLAAAKTLGHAEGVFVLVLAGAEWSDLCLFDGARMLGCRSVLAGDPEAEGWAERIAREIRPWVVSNEGLQHILLLGAVSEDVVDALTQTSGLPVTPGDPWQGVSDPRGYLGKLQSSAAYATAIGLAKAALSRQQELNLLPTQMKEAFHQQRKMAWVLTALVLAMGALTPVAVTANRVLRERQGVLHQLQQDVRHVHQTTGTPLSQAMTSAGMVDVALQSTGSRPLEIIRLLSVELPKGITLSNLTYDRDKTVVLQGRADTNTVLASAMAAITHLNIFDNAMLNYSTLLKGDAGQGYDFQITCLLSSGDDITLGTGKKSRKAPSQKGIVVR